MSSTLKMLPAFLATLLMFVVVVAGVNVTSLELKTPLTTSLDTPLKTSSEKAATLLPNPVCDWWSYKFTSYQCGFMSVKPGFLRNSYCSSLHRRMNRKLFGEPSCYQRSCNGYGDDIGKCYHAASCQKSTARGLCNKGLVCCVSKVRTRTPPRRNPPKRRTPRRNPPQRRTPSRNPPKRRTPSRNPPQRRTPPRNQPQPPQRAPRRYPYPRYPF